MKKLRLLSIFSVLLLGTLSNTLLSAYIPIKDVAEKTGTIKTKKNRVITVYLHQGHWKYGNYHNIDLDTYPEHCIQNISINDKQNNDGSDSAIARTPNSNAPINLFENLQGELMLESQLVTHPKDHIYQEATPNTTQKAILEDLHNAFNNWFSQQEEHYRYNFNALNTRCPVVQQFLQESIDSYGITQEALNEIVDKAWQLMNVDQALIDLVVELPENSVHSINKLIGIFNQNTEWTQYIQDSLAVRAYFKKCAVDQAFAESTDSLEDTITNIVADVEIVSTFPESIISKCVLYPRLFDALIAEGKTYAHDQEAQADFFNKLSILGETLTPHQLEQIETSNDINAQLTLTCNYKGIEISIQEWIHHNIDDNAELYSELVHDFFNNESLQDFFATCFGYEEQQLTSMITNFFEFLFDTQDPSFVAFYTALVSSVIFDSVEHLNLVFSNTTSSYFHKLFNNIPHDMLNSDVFVTLLNNPLLCECMQDENNWVFVNLVKDSIEHCDDTTKTSIFLLDNGDVFNHIIECLYNHWDEITETDDHKKNVIAALSNLISYVAQLYTLTDHGFAEWIFAVTPTTTSENVWNYIANDLDNDFSNIDAKTNWPGRVCLLKHHEATVDRLKNAASILGINRDVTLEDLHNFLDSYHNIINQFTNNTQNLLADSPDIANWVFDNNANDALNRAAMIENMIVNDNQLVEKICHFPRLARLICNKNVTTPNDLAASLEKYAHNDDVDMALRFGLYEFRYTPKGFDPDYASNTAHAIYPIERLFGGKFAELTNIIVSCAGLDGWFYTMRHSDRYIATAVQTVTNWLLEEFYDKPELDWTDPELNPRLQRLLDVANNQSDDNFAFRDSELLRYAIYDAALFDFVMNNPQACIDLSFLITATEATQETFAPEAVRLTQHLKDAGYLANHLVKIFIHARTIEGITNTMLSFFGNFQHAQESPAFNQTLQEYMDWANTQIATLPYAQQLGTAHLAMIKDILNGEADEKTATSRFKASCRWGQKYHPTATKIAITGAAIASNALITAGKAIACIKSPKLVLAELGQQVTAHLCNAMKSKLNMDSVLKNGVFTLLTSILSSSVYKAITESKLLSITDLTTISNLTCNLVPTLSSIVTTNLLQAQEEIVSANPELQDEVTFKGFCKEFALQFARSFKNVLWNFAFNNGGWLNFYKALTINNNEIRFGKKQEELKKQALGDMGNCITNLFFICKAIQAFFPIEEKCTALVDPNPEQGPTHVAGYNESAPGGYSKTIREHIKNLGYAPEQGQSAQAVLEGIRSCLRQPIPGTQNNTALVDPTTFNTGTTAKLQGHIAVATPQPISENARRWNVMEREMAARNASSALVEVPVQEDINNGGWVLEAANANNSTALVDPGSEIVDIVNNLIFRKDLGYAPMQTDEDYWNQKITFYDLMDYTKELFCNKNSQVLAGPLNEEYFEHVTLRDLMIYTEDMKKHLALIQ